MAAATDDVTMMRVTASIGSSRKDKRLVYNVDLREGG